MEQPEIFADIPNCWNCGHDQTITQKAWKDIYPDDENPPFVSMDKLQVPMTTEVGMVSLPSIPGLLLHMDYCAKCGAPRMVRAQKTNIPGQVFQQMLKQQGQQPPRR